jgi:probable HAF family extracellular repeat protein
MRVPAMMRRALWVGVVAATSGPPTAQAQAYSFTPIPGFATSPFSTHAYGVSADGSVAVGQAYVSNGWDGFKWTAPTGTVSLGRGSGWAVSDDNSFIAGQQSGDFPGRWSAATGWETFGNFPGQPVTTGQAHAISADGSVVVGYAYRGSATPDWAFRWSPGNTLQPLAMPAGVDRCYADAVSSDGSIIYGTMNLDHVTQAFRWTAATGGQVLGTNLDFVTDTSNDGSLAVGKHNASAAAGFRWSLAAGTFVIPPLQVNGGGQANGISGDGSIIVGTTNVAGAARAYIWDAAHGTRDLRSVLTGLGVNMDGWVLLSATGVSRDGRTIVGSGLGPPGIEQAWIATIPAPAGWVPLAALPFAIGRRRRGAQPPALLAAAGSMIATAAAPGQIRLERPDMPYRAPPGPTRVAPPPRFDPRDNFQTQVNVNPGGMNILGDAANEPSIAVDPTAPNRIAIGWRQFDTVHSNFRQAGRAYSRDGGRTWTNPGVLTPGTFRTDPCLRADAAGSIYYCSLDASFHTWIFRSTDGGATFGAPSPSFGGDKQWLAIDRTALASAGTQYQHWTGGFSRSFDNGATWMAPIGGTPPLGTSMVGPDGTLFIAGAGASVARSTNAWNPLATPTFSSAPVNLGGTIMYGAYPNPDGITGQACVDVDRSGGARHGWVYMLCSVSNPSQSCDVMFSRSTDGGQTWLSTPIRVNNDTPGPNAWHWFGAMGVSPDGRIDAIWNDTRESQSPRISRLYYAYSIDGGDTWIGNVPLGPAWDSWIGWPQQYKIGDYYDIASDRVGVFVAYAATYNNEQDVYFLRINEYDCNNNGIPDTVDLANGLLHDCNGNGIPDECEIAAGVAVPCSCYPNCDNSSALPFLNIQDFGCFLNRFAAGESYANCDGSTAPPVLNVADFSCFLNAFAAGDS